MQSNLNEVKKKLFHLNLHVLGWLSLLGCCLGIYFSIDVLVTVIFSLWVFITSLSLLLDKSSEESIRFIASFAIVLIGCLPTFLDITINILYPYLFVVIFIQALIGFFSTRSTFGFIFISIVIISYSLRFYFLNEISANSFKLNIVGKASISLTIMFSLYCGYTFIILFYAKILWNKTEERLLKQEKDLASEHLIYEERYIRLQKIRSQFEMMANYLSNRIIPHSVELNSKVNKAKRSKRNIQGEFSALVDKVDTDIKTMDDSLRFINNLIHQDKAKTDGPE